MTTIDRFHCSLCGFPGELSTSAAEPITPEDVPFGFPTPSYGGRGLGASNTGVEEHRLIQMGQLTPFGTSVTAPSNSDMAALDVHADSAHLEEKSLISMERLVVASEEDFLRQATGTASAATRQGTVSEDWHRDLHPADDTVTSQPHSSATEPALEPADEWMPSLAEFLDSDDASTKASISRTRK